MTVIIRPANVSDAQEIARIHVAAWQLAYRDLVPQAYLDALDMSERTEVWRSILAGELTVPGLPRPADFVAELDGRIAGFANVGLFRDEPTDESAGELWAMYVDPACWGDGVGDALMASAVAEFNRLGTVKSFLWVLEGNRRARRFYERHGWSSDGPFKTFEAGGVEVPEVRYSRPLS